MTSTGVGWTSMLFVLAWAVSDVHGQNYTAVPRWGQASAIIYDTLLISGGKIDPEHQFTYTSAPNCNDLLSLDLSTPFVLSSPPWTYISGSQNTSTAQGPAVAFHSLTPYTSSELLLFGGDSGFGAIQTNADSAWLLNINDRISPTWASQAAGWASEPIRRIYHAAPSASGAIYILGGQKADGSQIGFPDPYIFNAVADNGSPAFNPLTSTANAPAGLFGHAAHVLPGGALLVFGGFFSSGASPDTPSPFSTIYTLDTTSASPTWSIQNATGGTIPISRRGFASALLADGKILIHGGADVALQTLYSDGAILDTTQNPMTWIPVDGLSDTLGPRVGHFAVPIQGRVLFGFGWAGNAAANADLALYDPTSKTFLPTYTPPSTPVSITTLPITPTSPGGVYPTSGANTGQGTSGGSGSSTHSGKASSPSSGSGGGQDGGGGQNNGSTKQQPSMAGAVIGSVFGFLAFVAIVGGGVYYYLRKRERHILSVEGRWRLMPEEDPWDAILDDGPTQPGTVQMAGTGWHDQSRRGWGLLGLGGLIGVWGTYGTPGRRRLDMLADEDARQFDIDSVFHEQNADLWNNGNNGSQRGTRRRGTGGSSISTERHDTATGRSPWNDVWNASVTSLRNVGTALGVTAPASAAAQESMVRDKHSAERLEEKQPLDSFKDPAPAVISDPAWMEINSLVGPSDNARPRDDIYTAAPSVSSISYADPFADPHESQACPRNVRAEDSTSLLGDFHDGEKANIGDERSSQGSLPRSFAMMAISSAGSAAPSGSDRGEGTSVESHDATSSRTSQSTYRTGTGVASSSTDHNSSISSPTSPRATSIVGSITRPSVRMRRSDSWWSRFSRTSFLDRHSIHDAPQKTASLVDIRDPNPAPRSAQLGAIQESPHPSPQATEDSNLPSTSTSRSGANEAGKAGSAYAASTKSSIKTANSELIEGMDGRMVVVQRALSLTSRGTASPATTFDSLADSHQWGASSLEEASGSDDTHQPSWTMVSDGETEVLIAESPTETTYPGNGSPTYTRTDLSPDMEQQPDASSSNTSTGAQERRHRPPRRTLTGAVAERVSAYERRLSQSPPLDSTPRPKDERSRRGGVGYGLVPKAPLFIANPDRRNPSGST